MAIGMENRNAEGDPWEEFFEKAPFLTTTMQLAAYVVQNPHSRMIWNMFK